MFLSIQKRRIPLCVHKRRFIFIQSRDDSFSPCKREDSSLHRTGRIPPSLEKGDVFSHWRSLLSMEKGCTPSPQRRDDSSLPREKECFLSPRRRDDSFLTGEGRTPLSLQKTAFLSHYRRNDFSLHTDGMTPLSIPKGRFLHPCRRDGASISFE